MKRKHLVAVGAIIAIVLLLYWLFIVEDLNAWLNVWGIERSGFFNGREKWAKGFENQRV